MLKHKWIFLLLIGFSLGCGSSFEDDDRLHVVTTTNIIADVVREIAGDKVSLQSLMGPGVDPHLYKASEGDATKLFKADIVFYNGLHLEGKLADLFDKMKKRKTMIALGENLPKDELIASKNFGGNYDPHVWFNIGFFKVFAQTITEELAKQDVENAPFYIANNERYQEKLNDLEKDLHRLAEILPKEKRILVTAHDAFGYFGETFDFQVVGLQGISTATEAGVRDVRQLAEFIIEKEVKAIFIENSVPRRTIEALQAAVLSRNYQVEIGGSLYSDSLGNPGTEEGTYIGMFTYNMQTIVNALK